MENKTSNPAGARLQRFIGFLDSDPDNVSLRGEIFDMALDQGTLDIAEAQSEYCLSANPGDPAWLHRLALLLIAQRRYPEADEVLVSLQAGGHDTGVVRYNRAYIAYAETRYDACLAHLQSVAERETVLPEALTLQLRCMHRLGRIDEAVALFNAYILQAEAPGTAYGVASLLAVDAGRFRDAAIWSAQALRSNGARLEALTAQGSAALAQQDADQARRSFEEALQINPSEGRCWSGLGTALMLAMNLEAALKSFQEAVRFMPEHIGTWHGMGWCEVMLRRVQEAQKSFEQALALDRNFAESHGGLAVTLALQGNVKSAEDLIERALRLDSRSVSAQYARAIINGDAGDAERFRQLAERVLRGREGIEGTSLADLVIRRRH